MAELAGGEVVSRTMAVTRAQVRLHWRERGRHSGEAVQGVGAATAEADTSLGGRVRWLTEAPVRTLAWALGLATGVGVRSVVVEGCSSWTRRCKRVARAAAVVLDGLRIEDCVTQVRISITLIAI